MSNNDGGSAFPTTEGNYEQKFSDPGMTLRDYFAAKAMHTEIMRHGVEHSYAYAEVAKIAYRMADAMLEARKAGG